MRVVEFNQVQRSYGNETVLQGINLAVDAGQVVGLLGRNGAGKTTLLHLVMGLLAPDQGQVRVFAQDPRLDPVAVKKRIGYVAEDQELPAQMKVAEVLSLYKSMYPQWDDDIATGLASKFELPATRSIKDLSRGQARQVALLCAVSHRPELLILDEPAGGLDPAARRQFLETSIELLNEAGTTIIFSSHHMNDVERMASRLVMIHDRQKWIDSDLDDIRGGYSLALVPGHSVAGAESLLDLPNCLCARSHGENIHAVFERDPEACQNELQRKLGVESLQCRSLGLEEMFIELAGRDA